MSDLPSFGQLQQMHARPVSAEHLEVLGKKASAQWLDGSSSSLSAAVVETVKHAGLSPEQVKRVIEFANTDAYLSNFRKEGSHKVVNFPGGPADPSTVLQDLNDGGGGSVFDRGSRDYEQPPEERTKTSSAEQALYDQLRRDEAPIPYAEPLGPIFDMQTKLAGLRAHLTSELSGLEVAFHDLTEELYQNVKQAAQAGYSMGNVLQAWESVAPSADHLKVAFQVFTPRLLEDRVFSSVAAVGQSIEKTGSAKMVNPRHPLVTGFTDYCETLNKLAEVRAARAEVEGGLRDCRYFLKQAGEGGLVGGLVRGAEELSEPAGRLAHGVGKVLLGPGENAEVIGNLVRGGVKHAPHIGALIGAHELWRMARNNPSINEIKDNIMSAVPMTPQYQQREYNLQMGIY